MHPAEGSSSLQSTLLWPSQPHPCGRSFPNTLIPKCKWTFPQETHSSAQAAGQGCQLKGCFSAQRETMQPRGSQLPLFAPEEVGSYGNLCFNKREIKSILPFHCWRHPHFPLFITSYPLPRQPRQHRQGCWWQVGPVPAPHPSTRIPLSHRCLQWDTPQGGRGAENKPKTGESHRRGCSWQEQVLAPGSTQGSDSGTTCLWDLRVDIHPHGLTLVPGQTQTEPPAQVEGLDAVW